MDPFGIDWSALLRTAFVGALAYVALIAMLRVSGKRTLSQFNAFDFVVTVAIGSTLATILVSGDDLSLLRGLVALAVLVSLQFVITWTSLRSRNVSRLVKSEPTVVAYRGRPIPAVMARERLVPAELAAALRAHGLARVEDADLVVLETDGTITIVPTIDEQSIASSHLHEHMPIPRSGARSRGADARVEASERPTVSR